MTNEKTYLIISLVFLTSVSIYSKLYYETKVQSLENDNVKLQLMIQLYKDSCKDFREKLFEEPVKDKDMWL
jgi:hypothetical protein